jgi:drug/metabolite transporter (DMT)-like permease
MIPILLLLAGAAFAVIAVLVMRNNEYLDLKFLLWPLLATVCFVCGVVVFLNSGGSSKPAAQTSAVTGAKPVTSTSPVKEKPKATPTPAERLQLHVARRPPYII